MTDRRPVRLTGPARRALEHELPKTVASAAYTFITERLPVNPRHLGGKLAGPYAGKRAALLGTYRVVYRIDDDSGMIFVLSIRLRGDVYGTQESSVP